MGDDLVPAPREVRISDADREGVVARLNAAVGEGRLTLTEFEERVGGVWRARTFGEIEPYVADLPAPIAPANPDGVVVLRSRAGHLKRTGRWAVPRKLVVEGKAGAVVLDLRQAVLAHRVTEIELHSPGGSTTIVLPPGATADVDGLNTSAGAASVKVPAVPEPGSSAPHVVVTGTAAAGHVVVRYERRFWRWRW